MPFLDLLATLLLMLPRIQLVLLGCERTLRVTSKFSFIILFFVFLSTSKKKSCVRKETALWVLTVMAS